jgi:hypothetical protein
MEFSLFSWEGRWHAPCSFRSLTDTKSDWRSTLIDSKGGFLMSDITVVATVTPNALAPTGFDWSYLVSGNGFTIPVSQTLEIPSGASPEIMVNVVSGGLPNDTCVFQNPSAPQGPPQGQPLSFTDAQGNPINNPEWYQDLQFLDAATILFTDDNTNTNTTSYFILLNVVYTSGDLTVLATSPDPTIVNVGTDSGTPGVDFGPSSRPEPRAVAG